MVATLDPSSEVAACEDETPGVLYVDVVAVSDDWHQNTVEVYSPTVEWHDDAQAVTVSVTVTLLYVARTKGALRGIQHGTGKGLGTQRTRGPKGQDE